MGEHRRRKPPLERGVVDELIDLAEGHARRVLLERRHEELLMAFCIMSADRKLQVIGAPLDGDEERNAFLTMLGNAMRASGCLAYSVVNEAWIATYSEAEAPRGSTRWPARRPADREDRREVVVAFAADRDGEKRMKTWEIIRGPDARIADLKYLSQESDCSNLEGRFTDLLED
jgi:hypothetical protein